MPSVTRKQAHFMSAISHGWRPTNKKGPPLSVAREFHDADKRVGKWEHPGRLEKLKGRAKTRAER